MGNAASYGDRKTTIETPFSELIDRAFEIRCFAGDSIHAHTEWLSFKETMGAEMHIAEKDCAGLFVQHVPFPDNPSTTENG